MAHSVETRVPFLDHELVETVLGSAPETRIDRGVPKVLLGQALKVLLPAEVVYRPKMTFTFPVQEWLAQNDLAPSVPGFFPQRCKCRLAGFSRRPHRLGPPLGPDGG
jgi:asparagine synthetase B (glutamine-hydrolysing)